MPDATPGGLVQPDEARNGDESDRALRRAHHRLIARRLPRFAVLWVCSSVVWSVALYLGGQVAAPGMLVAPMLHGAILVAALALCRVERLALGAIMAASVLLGLTTIALFVAIGGDGDVLAFVLLTLHLLAGIVFVWGWRAELALLVTTAVPWALAIPQTHFHVPTAELVAAIAIGSVISLAIAEGAARGFSVAFRHRENEKAGRRALEVSRNAYRDLAARERAARVEAEAARHEAEAAARARGDFLAMLSHELRSPLGSILTWTRMLRRGMVSDARVPTALANLEEAAEAQERMVDDLLDISRIAAGKFSLRLEPVDLPALVAASIEARRETAGAKRITLEERLDRSVGPVRADPTRLHQVFENLLTNALKFTPAGGRVSVTVDRVDDEAEVTVRDTGIGIPADVLPHVFDEFQQADPSITRRYGGLGLGLAIARRLVEGHGGRIEATSPGQEGGSTFRVRLPLAPGAAVVAPGARRRARPARRAARSRLEGVRVILVEDDPQARDLLATLLAGSGAEVCPAGSVREAVEGVAAKAPDVVVADIAMPGEDGYALVRQLRAMERQSGRHLPVIAVTALASAEDRERAIVEGFDEHLTKPIDPTDLLDAIARSTAR